MMSFLSMILPMLPVAAPRGGLGGLVPPISHRDQFSNSSKSDEKEWGGGATVGFINVSRSNKYTCRVTKNCVFKLLHDLENSLHYYPENPGNCISGIPDFKIFSGEHAPGPPRWLSPLARDCPPSPNSMPWCRLNAAEENDYQEYQKAYQNKKIGMKLLICSIIL